MNAETYLQGTPSREKSSILLLDSCSTADIISNPRLLHDITPCDVQLPMRTLAVNIYLNMQGRLGQYPNPVWYYPHGHINILSLFKISQYYRVTMDSSIENALILHNCNGTKTHFQACHRSLYHAASHNSDVEHMFQHTRNKIHVNSLVIMVKGNASMYPKRLYQRAVQARELQNIIMRPSSKQIRDVVIKHLANCPVTRSDIIATDHIFGPNLGSLKGKTPRRLPDHVKANIDPVPQQILRTYKNITLCTDIIFINKIPFLVTLSHHIKFLTIESLANRQITIISKKIKEVIQIYKHQGFQVAAILADQEFKPLRANLPTLNTSAQDEHQPDAKRHIRSIKDRVRSMYSIALCRKVEYTTNVKYSYFRVKIMILI